MKNFLKKSCFVAVSTFLALVLSIVSFGTYRNVAKADGDFISGVHRLTVESFVEDVLDDIGQNGGDLSMSVIIVDHQIAGTTQSDYANFMSLLRACPQYTDDLKVIVQMGNSRYRDLDTNQTSMLLDLIPYMEEANREVYGMGIWTIDSDFYYLFKDAQDTLNQTDYDGAKKPVMYLIERDPITTGPDGISAKVCRGPGAGFDVYAVDIA